MSDQTWRFIALGALSLASLLASVAAWVQLWRDRRARKAEAGVRPKGSGEAHP